MTARFLSRRQRTCCSTYLPSIGCFYKSIRQEQKRRGEGEGGMEGKGEGKREGKGKRDRDALITFLIFLYLIV